MPDGDYLWRVDDHDETRRQIARHSPRDAEAYDDYNDAMVEMARFVRPLLSMLPPDPTSLDPRGLARGLGLVRRFRHLPRRQRHGLVQLMTMSAADFLDQCCAAPARTRAASRPARADHWRRSYC